MSHLTNLDTWLKINVNASVSGLRVLSFSCLAASAATIWIFRRRGTQQRRSNVTTKSNDPNKNRGPGEWTPVQFTYPQITPCPVELSSLKPLPYRPFRWGDYHVTMGIRSMGWQDWIELDCQYPAYQRIRKHRIDTRYDRVIRVLPDVPGLVRSGAEAAIELVHELAEYLSRRHPITFQIERHPPRSQPPYSYLGWEDAPPIKRITISPLGESYELPLDANNGGAEKAMEISALLVQDDLALMIEGTDGKYYFQAGAICIAGSWRLEDKIGLPLDEIHISGRVPQYKEKLHTSLERFFRRMPVDKPVIRHNFSLQLVTPKDSKRDDGLYDVDPEELAWAAWSNGPEDAFDHRFSEQSVHLPPPTIDTIRFRSERQTLRRLPRTGAVLFGIRTYVVPVEELGRERGVPGRMASAMRSWPEDVGVYKGRKIYMDVLSRYMDDCHARQIENGEIEEGEKVGLYPY